MPFREIACTHKDIVKKYTVLQKGGAVKRRTVNAGRDGIAYDRMNDVVNVCSGVVKCYSKVGDCAYRDGFHRVRSRVHMDGVVKYAHWCSQVM